MARTNYIFIDFENVHETEFERIEGKPVHLTVVLGKEQKKLTVPTVQKMLRCPGQIELVQNSSCGKDALDRILTYCVGGWVKQDPTGFFHIVAKDSGYDNIIGFCKERGVFAARRESLASIPLLMNKAERLKYLTDEYWTEKTPVRGSRKAVESQIQQAFARSVSDQEMEWLLQCLKQSKMLQLDDDKKCASAKA